MNVMAPSRRVSFILIGLLVIVAAVLLFCTFPVSVAEAELYYVGDASEILPLDYGAPPGEHVLYHKTSGKYYKITSYNVVLNYVPTSLVEGGVVTALPGEYPLNVEQNAVYCDKDGNPLTGDSFYGTVLVVVRENELPITIESASLTKAYGAEASPIVWSCDDPYITEVVFSCEGFLPTAPVGSYPVTVSAIMKGEENVTDLYISQVTLDEGEGDVLYTVTPAPVSFEISEVATRPFNRYFLADGESVHSVTTAGVNGETLTAYYHFKDSVEGVLSIGESYDIEAYRYEVTSSGTTTSYRLDQASNYAPTFSPDNDHIVAGKGLLTITQDPLVIEAHPNDLSYLHLPMIYEYLDAAVYKDLDHPQEYWLTITYFDESIILYFGADEAYQALPTRTWIPCGSYALTLEDYSHDVMDTISAEGELSLNVGKRTLAYQGQDTAEVASGDTFQKSVSVTYEGVKYDFTLTAGVAGRSVGDVLSYASATSLTNENVDLDYSAARLTMVKRSTGISIVSSVGSSVTYGDAFVPAALWLNKGKAGESKLESETLIYAYSSGNSTARTAGLPQDAGSYTIYCSLDSDTYAVAEKRIALRIDKRPVAGYFVLVTTSKVYGETFDFADSNNAQLTTLYELDASLQAADRTKVISGFTRDMVFGSSLTSAGGAKEAVAGRYDFDYSGVLMLNYRLATAIYWDKGANKAVRQFTVEKADSPAPPTVSLSISGRTVRVSASPLPSGTAELSLSSDFSDKLTATVSEGRASFSQLTYGARYYVRVCSVDSANYDAPSAWASTQTIAAPFPSLSLTLVERECDAITVIAEPLENALEGYTLQYRVGSTGTWTDGSRAVGLDADRDYVIYFRAKNPYVEGAATQISARTLRAPVAEDDIALRYDRDLETLYIGSEVEGLECRLLSSSGEYLTEWISYDDLPTLAKDATYTLEVRFAATEEKEASGILSIEIDTHEAETPFTVKGFLSDWFLIVIGGGILLVALILLLVLIKAKRRADKEILGG